MILRALEFLGRHATLVLAGGVLAGLALPWLAELARPMLIPGLVIPLTIALVRLDWSALGAYGRRPGLIGLLCLWILLVSPLLMAGVTALIPMPEALRAGLVLMSASAPIVSAAALALILGLDAALTVVLIVTTTALVPFTLPTVALWLLGLKIEIGPLDLMWRLALLVGSSFLAAAIARRFLSREWIAARARMFDGVSVSILLLFALAIMAGKTDVLLTRPQFFFLVVGAAFLANVTLQLIGAVAFRRVGERRSLSVGLMSGNRNMGLVLVALAGQAHFDVEVFFALAQIPMYALPAILNPIYRRAMRGERP